MPSERVLKTIQLRKEHPNWSLQRIGTELGISRVAVYKTLKKFEQTTYAITYFKKQCPVCFKKTVKTHKYCSNYCARKHISATVHCAYCGVKFFKKRYCFRRYLEDKQHNFYCSLEHFYIGYKLNNDRLDNDKKDVL